MSEPGAGRRRGGHRGGRRRRPAPARQRAQTAQGIGRRACWSRVRSGLPGLHRRAAAGRRAGARRPGRRRPGDHRRAGRAQRHLAGHGHPVLPGAGLRRLRRPAARHRRRDRPGGALGRLDRRHRPGDPADRPARRGCSARSWPPTPGPCTTPPRCSTSAEVERAADAIAAAPPGGHLRRQRQRAGRRGDAVQPAPHRRRRRGPGPTSTTGWPAPRCSRAGDVALGVSHSGADPGDHRDARRGRQPAAPPPSR